jgi:hypothetical protein
MQPQPMRPAHALCIGFLAVAVGAGCASHPAPSPTEGDTYIQWAAFPVPINESVILRWPKDRMPLRIYLPRPPSGMFDDPDAIYSAVRKGVLAWAGVAGPDLPSFVFLGAEGHADIPFVWDSKATGDWFIAHTVWDIQPLARRFGVSRILLTARWPNGHVANPRDIQATVMHEMGHALGICNHSPHPGDIMYASVSRAPAPHLTARDRATLKLLYALPIGKRIVNARRDVYR